MHRISPRGQRGEAMDLVAGVRRVIVVIEHSSFARRARSSPLELIELAPEISVEYLRSRTSASFRVAATL